MTGAAGSQRRRCVDTQPLSETKSVRYFGKVENLFDREYFERGYRIPGRTITVGMALSF